MYLYPPKKIPRTYEVGSLESLFFYVYLIFAFPLTGKKFYIDGRTDGVFFGAQKTMFFSNISKSAKHFFGLFLLSLKGILRHLL